MQCTPALLMHYYLAENSFKGSKRIKKHLIVFSDMIEDCGLKGSADSYNFSAVVPANPDIIINDLKKVRRMPKLEGVTVYVIGPTGGYQQSDSVSRYLAVKSFWEVFFEKAGATVKRYGAPIEYP